MIYAYIFEERLHEVIEPMFWPAGMVKLENGSLVLHSDGTPFVSPLAGKEIALNDRFAPDFVAACVDITHVHPQPRPGWVYQDGKFHDAEPNLDDNEP